MNDNKQVLKFCPNYYSIIEFNPLVEDKITQNIIKMYKEYIFKVNINDEFAVNELKEFDAAVYKYINDYAFRKEVQKQIASTKIRKDCKDIVKEIFNVILNIFSTYSEYTTKILYISRWI